MVRQMALVILLKCAVLGKDGGGRDPLLLIGPPDYTLSQSDQAGNIGTQGGI